MKKKLVKKISLKSKASSSSKSKNSEFITMIKEDLKTPVCTLHFCAISSPIYFPGNSVPRFKVSILLDEKNKTHKKFLSELELLAEEFNVPTIGKRAENGSIIISYLGKDAPETYILEKNKRKPEIVELDHDVDSGFDCVVVCDLKRYYDKFNKKNAFNFTPKKVIFHLDENSETEEVKNGNRKNSRS